MHFRIALIIVVLGRARRGYQSRIDRRLFNEQLLLRTELRIDSRHGLFRQAEAANSRC
jgi:hypothetical protein